MVMLTGSLPTWIALCRTSRVSGLIRVTVSSPELATQIPPAAITPAG